MAIIDITETENEQVPKTKPVKEIMNIHIPNVPDGVPNLNGSIWVLSGSGGSGKTSTLLNFFKKKELYRGKFDNVFYISPESSMSSVEKHPFEGHDKIYNELTGDTLKQIYSSLDDLKKQSVEEEDPMYNCVIIDDFADKLKDKDVQRELSKMLIKARQLLTVFIFVLQSYYYFPKILRKQITYLTMFKPKNAEEWTSIAKELLYLKDDDALKVYDYVFDENYNHLDVDTVLNKYYKNFNPLTFHTTSDLEKPKKKIISVTVI